VAQQPVAQVGDLAPQQQVRRVPCEHLHADPAQPGHQRVAVGVHDSDAATALGLDLVAVVGTEEPLEQRQRDRVDRPRLHRGREPAHDVGVRHDVAEPQARRAPDLGEAAHLHQAGQPVAVGGEAEAVPAVLGERLVDHQQAAGCDQALEHGDLLGPPGRVVRAAEHHQACGRVDLLRS
jgi:hypothetical protein